MNIYKITPTNTVWVKKAKPFYVVAESKEAAIKYLNSHLKDGYEAKAASLLGRQLGFNLFSANNE